MCSRFAQFRSARAYAEHFGAQMDAPAAQDAAGIRDVGPNDDAFVLRRHPQTGALHLTALRWGLVPAWAETPLRGARLMNARSETVTVTSSFKDAWRKRRRCVVPAEGFYEWARRGDGKTPYYMGLKSGAPVPLAGLWEGWQDAVTGEWRRTFTILTCPPNALIAPLHERMPVILREADIPSYLEGEDPRALLAPFPGEEMVLEQADPRYAMPDAPRMPPGLFG